MRRLALLALAMGTAGCLEPPPGITLLDERFEDGMDLWTVTGPVEIVTTYHPGEHGLRFLGAAELTRAIGLTIYDEYQDGNWIEYTTSCGGVPQVTIAQELDLTWRVVLLVPTADDGTPEEFERVYASLPPIPRAESTPATVSALTVIGDGGGPCVIDNLRLVQPEPESGW